MQTLELDLSLLLSITGIDSPSSLERVVRSIEVRIGQEFQYIPLDTEYLTTGTWIIGDWTRGVFKVGSLVLLAKDGKFCGFGELLSHLLNAQKMAAARCHYPAESRPESWQLASAINAVMTLLGPSYGWKRVKDTTVNFGHVGEETDHEIEVDVLIPFVRNILNTWEVADLSRPSKVYQSLIGLSLQLN